ncbi:unnamed protein product, partial [Rotaria sordida]
MYSYCIGYQLDQEISDSKDHYQQTFTFEQFHQNNVISNQFYASSASIDLIGYYQIYLII